MSDGTKKFLVCAAGIATGVVVGQLIYTDVIKRWLIKG